METFVCTLRLTIPRASERQFFFSAHTRAQPTLGGGDTKRRVPAWWTECYAPLIMPDAFFWKIHSGLEREGPGDDASLRRALGLMKALPANPDILDVGCGPGAQSLALAELTGGTITSVDTHQPFLDALNQAAGARGVAARVRTVNASMANMPFGERSFDVIWSEGAIYMMGFREGLANWKRFLKRGGYIAVTEPCWTKPDEEIPPQAREWWKEYPAIASVEKILSVGAETGYRGIGHFVLPASAWWNYYGPKEARIATLRRKYRDNPAALERLAAAQSEIELYRLFGDCYSYLFVVMQLP
jgi:SAM-dependent methyltransferase